MSGESQLQKSMATPFFVRIGPRRSWNAWDLPIGDSEHVDSNPDFRLSEKKRGGGGSQKDCTSTAVEKKALA